MWKKLIQQVVGEEGYDSGKDAEEVGLEGTSAAIVGITAIDIWGHELESGAPVFCDGATVLLTGLVVEYLLVNGVVTLIVVGHDTVVHMNAVLVVAGLERLEK